MFFSLVVKAKKNVHKECAAYSTKFSACSPYQQRQQEGEFFFLLSCSHVAIAKNNLKCLLLEDRHKFKKFNFAIKIFNERRKETQKKSVEGRK